MQKLNYNIRGFNTDGSTNVLKSIINNLVGSGCLKAEDVPSVHLYGDARPSKYADRYVKFEDYEHALNSILGKTPNEPIIAALPYGMSVRTMMPIHVKISREIGKKYGVLLTMMVLDPDKITCPNEARLICYISKDRRLSDGFMKLCITSGGTRRDAVQNKKMMSPEKLAKKPHKITPIYQPGDKVAIYGEIGTVLLNEETLLPQLYDVIGINGNTVTLCNEDAHLFEIDKKRCISSSDLK